MPAAGVVHRQLDGAREPAHAQLDALALAGVADRVLDQVVEHDVDAAAAAPPPPGRGWPAAPSVIDACPAASACRRRTPRPPRPSRSARRCRRSAWLSSCTSMIMSSISWRIPSTSARVWAIISARASSAGRAPSVSTSAEDALQRRAQLVRDAGREQAAGVAVVGLGALVLEHDDAARARPRRGTAARGRGSGAARARRRSARARPRRPPGQRRRDGAPSSSGWRVEVEQQRAPAPGERVCPHQPAVAVEQQHGARRGRHQGVAPGQRRRQLRPRRRCPQPRARRRRPGRPRRARGGHRPRRSRGRRRAGRRRSRAPQPTPPSLLSSPRA